MSLPEVCFLVVGHEAQQVEALVQRLRGLYPGTELVLVTASSWAQGLETFTLRTSTGAHLPLVIFESSPHEDSLEFFRHIRSSPAGQESRLMLLSATIPRELLSHGLAEKLVDSYLSVPLEPVHFAAEVKRCVSSYFLDLHPEVIAQAPAFVSHVALHKALDEALRSRQKIASELNTLRSGALLRALVDSAVLSRLGARVAQWLTDSEREHQIQSFEVGDILLAEGEPNDGIWFVLEGQVAQEKMGRLGTVELLVQGVGEVIGLLSLLSSQPAFATIRAKTRCRCARLSRENLDRMLSEDSEFLVEFLHALMFVMHSRVTALSETKVQLQESYSELRETQTKLVESEKMAAIGILSAGIAHELNNPSAALARGAEHLRTEIVEVLEALSSPSLPVSNPADLPRLGLEVLRASQTSVPPTTSELRERARLLESAGRMTAPEARRRAEIEWLFRGAALELPAATQDVDFLHRYLVIGRFLNIVQSCSERISRLVLGMRDYAAAESQEFVCLDVRKGIQDTLLILGDRLSHYQVETREDHLDNPMVIGVPAKLNQVWTNLLINACDATPPGGSLTVVTSNESDERGDLWVVVSLADTGSGIPAEVAPHIFEPRFTTKSRPSVVLTTGKVQERAASVSTSKVGATVQTVPMVAQTGLGLGLALVKKIMTDHGGVIGFTSEVNRGTEFVVKLRCASQESMNSQASVKSGSPQ